MSTKNTEEKIKEEKEETVNNTTSEGKKFTKSEAGNNEKKMPGEKESEQKNEDEQNTDFQIIEELKAKNNEINDKYLRLYSEFDNFRKRTIKERIELIKSAGEEVISTMLPILDDFERAIKSSENSQDINVIKEGIQLIFQKMKNILSLQGLKEMEIKDGEFNADLHDAITKISTDDEKQKGKIVDIVEKGYYLNDRVIRHAKVVVGE